MTHKFIFISEEIIKRINEGDLTPGDKIPSENELIKTFKVSNTTARKSLLRLETLGWVRRIKGKGTFVLNRTGDHQIFRILGSIEATRKGFHESLLQDGFTPKNIVLEKTILQEGISTMIQHKQLTLDGPVLKIRLLRYADDDILKDETRYVSLTLCPKIERISPEISFFKTYEQTYHIKIKTIEQTLKTTIFDQDTADNYFENKKPLSVFILDSAVINEDGNIIEIEHSFYSGDKYQFGIIAQPSY